MTPELIFLAMGGLLSSSVLGTVVTVLWNRSKHGQEQLRHDLAAERVRTDELARKLDTYFRYMTILRDHVLIMHEGTGMLASQIVAHGAEPVWHPPPVPPVPE